MADEQKDSSTALKKQRTENKINSNSPKIRHIDELKQVFHLPLAKAATRLSVCGTVLKKLSRRYGIARWPYRLIRRIDKAATIIRQSLTNGLVLDDPLVAVALASKNNALLVLRCQVIEHPDVDWSPELDSILSELPELLELSEKARDNDKASAAHMNKEVEKPTAGLFCVMSSLGDSEGISPAMGSSVGSELPAVESSNNFYRIPSQASSTAGGEADAGEDSSGAVFVPFLPDDWDWDSGVDLEVLAQECNSEAATATPCVRSISTRVAAHAERDVQRLRAEDSGGGTKNGKACLLESPVYSDFDDFTGIAAATAVDTGLF